jgi:transcriptional regulator with XRE-family HTH domain
MSDTVERLRQELKDPEMSEGYAESFLDSFIATQIKVLRERDGLSQRGLAALIGTRQGVISRIENVNYSKWNVTTLKKLGRAFRVRVKVSFETYGSLLNEVASFSRESLEREPRERDRILNSPITLQPGVRSALKATHRATFYRQKVTTTHGALGRIDAEIRHSNIVGSAIQQGVPGAQAATAALMSQR